MSDGPCFALKMHSRKHSLKSAHLLTELLGVVKFLLINDMNCKIPPYEKRYQVDRIKIPGAIIAQ